ncbi:HTH domain-containing protein [Candidatus Woesearchaeota archaeon]|nr:HTH domain-containing protein [Candidatus Woesearchaeota archaeon]
MKKIDSTLVKIQNILLEDTRGLTIQELADQTKVSRVTCGMALMKLEGQRVIDVRVIGNCKLHYLNVEKEHRKKGAR